MTLYGHKHTALARENMRRSWTNERRKKHAECIKKWWTPERRAERGQYIKKCTVFCNNFGFCIDLKL